MYGVDNEGKQIGVTSEPYVDELAIAIRKKEGQARLNMALSAIQASISNAQAIADEYALDFSWEPRNLGTYYGKGSTADGRYEDGETTEGEWYPSSWSSSSIYC